jgi:hypothetical protein
MLDSNKKDITKEVSEGKYDSDIDNLLIIFKKINNPIF